MAPPPPPTFACAPRGQAGEIPQLGLGTVALSSEHVSSALKLGYRHLDCALLYGNQEGVGAGLRASGVPRSEVFLTSKVAFFPAGAEGCWMHNANNIKGQEAASIDLTLQQLGVSQVDLLLVHNPTTSKEEYAAASVPHFFELFNHMGKDEAIRPVALPDGARLRPMILSDRRAAALRTRDPAAAKQARRETWLALERAQREGKCRYIGVANYPAALLLEMKEYATVMPAVNQLELHPWFDSAELRRVARELGVVLMAYGSCHSTMFQQSDKIAAIASRLGRSPTQVVLRWTLQSGSAVIAKAASAKNQAENLAALDFELPAEDLAALSALNIDYPYYWTPLPTIDTLAEEGEEINGSLGRKRKA